MHRGRDGIFTQRKSENEESAWRSLVKKLLTKALAGSASRSKKGGWGYVCCSGWLKNQRRRGGGGETGHLRNQAFRKIAHATGRERNPSLGGRAKGGANERQPESKTEGEKKERPLGPSFSSVQGEKDGLSGLSEGERGKDLKIKTRGRQRIFHMNEGAGSSQCHNEPRNLRPKRRMS